MRIDTRPLNFLWLAPLAAVLSACGGGADDDGLAETTANTSSERSVALAARMTAPRPAPVSLRISAARATAESASNACAQVRPYYWELGTRDGRSTGGSVGTDASGKPVTAKTSMPYASASKWLYGAYVVERNKGVLSATDVQMLTFRSGYSRFRTCERGQTVDACLASGSNGQYSALTDGAFYYNGGHMQKHASMNGLGAMDNTSLAAAVRTQLGSGITVAYSQPQPAGGAYGTAQNYAAFLRKLLGGQLAMSKLLGSSSACASPATCAAHEALGSPAPEKETWRYSLGHWVEADPRVGDGAFSSGGAFGFYPWVDAGRTNYGIVARSVKDGGQGSMLCGRLIRKAFATGVAL
jgi:hypothetical protein